MSYIDRDSVYVCIRLYIYRVMQGNLANSIAIANQQLSVLNLRIKSSELVMYRIPRNPSASYIRQMVFDLDWMMNHIDSRQLQSVHVVNKYTEVRNKLIDIYEQLDEFDDIIVA